MITEQQRVMLDNMCYVATEVKLGTVLKDIVGETGEVATKVELERIKYYGDKDVIPSPESYFVVNTDGDTITGLTEEGKTQTELVVPYEINGKKIVSIVIGSTSQSNASFNSIKIPNSITRIGDSAFFKYSALTSINIPESVTSISSAAFYGCYSLKSINISNSVTGIGQVAFEYCTSLTSINIPYGVTTIETSTFQGCTSLKSIDIPNSVTSIGALSFSGCTSLKSIDIPNSVTSIEYGAFQGCDSLKSINIPNSVTSIEDPAFSGCDSLTIYCGQGSYAETYAKQNDIPIVYTTINKIESEVEIIDNLTTSDSTKALSANQGRILQLNLDKKANISEVLRINTPNNEFTPTLPYHPATKKYVDDSISISGGGDMLKTVYDTDNTGVVDNAEKLGGQLPSYYAKSSSSVVVTLPNTIADWTTNTDEEGKTYYTKNFSNVKFTEEGTPFIGINYSDTISVARQEVEAYNSIDRVKVTDGKAVFYCFNDVPSVSLNIQIKIVY